MINESNLHEILLNDNIGDFLNFTSDFDNSFWEKTKNLDILIDAIKIENLGLRDYIYRVISDLSNNQKKYAAERISDYLFYTNKEIRNFSSDLLIKLGFYSNEKLVSMINIGDADIKKFIADILGYTSTSSELPALLNLIDDSDINVKISAIESIGNLTERFSLDKSTIDQIKYKLINLYELDITEIKPVIINSLSKIGGEDISTFLFHKLAIEEDIFIKAIIIDAMSVCGNSIDFCNKLQTEIYTYPFAIQTILLKSLIAVSMRIAYKINFGENDRNLIYRALEDNDPDVRIAGLIALGDKFSENDALYIFDIYNNSSDEIKYYIVNKFLSIPNIGLFNIFLLQFIKNFQSEELELYLMEMFGFIQNFISEIDDKVIEVFFEELLNTLINIEYIEVSGIFESIKNIHSELFDIVLRKCTAKSTAPKLQKFNLLSEYLTKL